MSKKVSIKKIISVISTVLLTVTFVFALVSLSYVLIQTLSGKEASLFGVKLYYVESDSMAPTIEKGDMIVSRVIKEGLNYVEIDTLINEGDVITFSQEVKGIRINNTHRVVKDVYYDSALGCHCVVTKGDNPLAPEDTPLPITAIKSRMLFEMDNLSSIYEFLGSTTGIIIAIVLPMVLLLISTIYQLVLRLKKPEKTSSSPSSSSISKEREQELKRQAIEDYLRSQAIKEYLENNEISTPNQEDKAPKNKDNE